jgi:hypothetical protein
MQACQGSVTFRSQNQYTFSTMHSFICVIAGGDPCIS